MLHNKLKFNEWWFANYLDELQEKTISIQIKYQQHSQWFESNHPHWKNPSYLKITLANTYLWLIGGDLYRAIYMYTYVQVSRSCTISQLLVSVYLSLMIWDSPKVSTEVFKLLFSTSIENISGLGLSCLPFTNDNVTQVSVQKNDGQIGWSLPAGSLLCYTSSN